MPKPLTSEAGKFPLSVPIVFFLNVLLLVKTNDTISICRHPFSPVLINNHSTKTIVSLASNILSVENLPVPTSFQYFNPFLTRLFVTKSLFYRMAPFVEHQNNLGQQKLNDSKPLFV
jgi:hypothetical protein